MAVKIFLQVLPLSTLSRADPDDLPDRTGATGYIGGTALDCIVKAHPEHEYTLLVRDEQRAAPIKAKYPNVKFAYGRLEDATVLEKAAAEADVVVHTADSSDNLAGAVAIAKGLKDGHSADRPGYWIHTSGTAILTWYDTEQQRQGDAPLPEQKYRDVDDIDRIVDLPDTAPHRNIDKVVLAANSDAVRIAVVCPPTIYGPGTGAVNTRSIQVPDLVKATLSKGFAPIVGEGKTEWDHVHVQDLGDLFVKLVEASQDASRRENPDVFGPRAYFFAENGTHSWADVAHWIAEAASRQGYLPEGLTKFVSVKEIQLMPEGNPTWGLNSKGVSQRAAKYLGWQPKGAPLKDMISELVAQEAKDSGLTPKEKKG
ncbi:NAD(P)H-binding domain-containing protein [Hirsutella rhossiliensis]|uniref:NAD(P)H-binding domain-containing protein n=1 Tax=Hirsutella rhossiliensis TaxID=111463 RepID=A0A9P8SGW7_9HYPO|nr:NAD(P)H-binding domain-containing protein [Hirsutella rhossiliensis]KAH0962508.1 NAD(P)H-binding domain-containing protein [Hirsutella rhossiliensis]